MDLISNEPILVGDVGGTHVRFGLAAKDETGQLNVTGFVKLKGDDFGSLEEALSQYLSLNKEQGIDQPRHMSMALAGPLQDGVLRLTNRDWMASESEFRHRFGFVNVRIFNDFVAMSRSIPETHRGDLITVRSGTPLSDAPILVAGAGTGFGASTIKNIAGQWHVFPSESGHIAYSPQSDSEIELFQILKRKYGYVSVELVTSGSGLAIIHQAVCQRQGVEYKPLTPVEISKKITMLDPVCMEIARVRANATMGAIGDLALATGARGGIMLAGGVSERMIDFLQKDEAMLRFSDRGPMSHYVENIPIKLLVNPIAPLIGAAALYINDL